MLLKKRWKIAKLRQEFEETHARHVCTYLFTRQRCCLLALLTMSVLHNSPDRTNWSQWNSEQGRLLWRWKTSRREGLIFFNDRARGTLGGRGHCLQHTDRRMSAAHHQRSVSWGTGRHGSSMRVVQGFVVSVGFSTAHADQLKPSSFWAQRSGMVSHHKGIWQTSKLSNGSNAMVVWWNIKLDFWGQSRKNAKSDPSSIQCFHGCPINFSTNVEKVPS